MFRFVSAEFVLARVVSSCRGSLGSSIARPVVRRLIQARISLIRRRLYKAHTDFV